MKYQKERKFVKRMNEILKEEVNTSKIIILESGIKDKEINYVMYEDRFGRQFQVNNCNGYPQKNEFIK